MCRQARRRGRPSAYGTGYSAGLFVAVLGRSCAGTRGSSNRRRTHGATSALIAGAPELADVIDTPQIVAISTSSAPLARLDRSNIAGRAPRVKVLLADVYEIRPVFPAARTSRRHHSTVRSAKTPRPLVESQVVVACEGLDRTAVVPGDLAEVGDHRKGTLAGPVQTNRRSVGSLNASMRARRRPGRLDVHEVRRHRTRTDGEPT